MSLPFAPGQPVLATLVLIICAIISGCSSPIEPTAGTEIVRRVGRQGVVMVSSNCGTGSGFFFANEGDVYVMTNAHVVNAGHSGCEPTGFMIETKSAIRRQAVVVFKDETSDIAILKIFTTEQQPDFRLTALVLSNSTPFPKQQIIVWGAPYGEGLVPLDGLVTSLSGNTVPTLETNVSVQPGSSGGPVLDARTGLVIGVIRSRSQDIAGAEGVSDGTSFAVRADYVRKLLGKDKQLVDWVAIRARPLPSSTPLDRMSRGTDTVRPVVPAAPVEIPRMTWIVHGIQTALMRAAALTPALYAALAAVWLLIIGRPVFLLLYLCGAALLAYVGDQLFQSGVLTVLGNYIPMLAGPVVAFLGVLLCAHLLLRAILALHILATGADAVQSRSARIATGLIFRPWVVLPLTTIILSATWILIAWALVWKAGR